MYDYDDMYGTDGYGANRPRNAMARASLNLGILSLLFCSIFYVALPCGALAILCAILSRTGSKLQRRCRTAIITGSCGIAVSLILTGFMVQRVFSDPELRSYIEYYLQAYTGDYDLDLDEELSRLLPFLSDSSENGGDSSDGVSENSENGSSSTPNNSENEDDGKSDNASENSENEDGGRTAPSPGNNNRKSNGSGTFIRYGAAAPHGSGAYSTLQTIPAYEGGAFL